MSVRATKVGDQSRERLQFGGGVRCREELAHTHGSRFRGAGQVIHAASRMRLEVGETLVFAFQRHEQRQQRDVLVDVREVSGVVAVTILHRSVIVGTLKSFGNYRTKIKARERTPGPRLKSASRALSGR